MWEESGVTLWQTQVGLASSKTDSRQHTAEPIHHVCDTSRGRGGRQGVVKGVKSTRWREELEEKVRKEPQRRWQDKEDEEMQLHGREHIYPHYRHIS